MQPVLPPYLIARWLVLIVLLVGLYFLKDFLLPVLGALVIGLASWPLYRKLLAYCRYRYTLAATLALLVFIGVLLIPLSMALSFVIQEASSRSEERRVGKECRWWGWRGRERTWII